MKRSFEPTEEKKLGVEPLKKKSTVIDLTVERSVKIGRTLDLAIPFRVDQRGDNLEEEVARVA